MIKQNVIFWCCDCVNEFSTHTELCTLVLWISYWIQDESWLLYPGAMVFVVGFNTQINVYPVDSILFTNPLLKLKFIFWWSDFVLHANIGCYILVLWFRDWIQYENQVSDSGALMWLLNSIQKLNFVSWCLGSVTEFHTTIKFHTLLLWYSNRNQCEISSS